MTRKWQTREREARKYFTWHFKRLLSRARPIHRRAKRDTTMTSAKSRFLLRWLNVPLRAILICMIFLHRIILQLISFGEKLQSRLARILPSSLSAAVDTGGCRPARSCLSPRSWSSLLDCKRRKAIAWTPKNYLQVAHPTARRSSIWSVNINIYDILHSAEMCSPWKCYFIRKIA